MLGLYVISCAYSLYILSHQIYYIIKLSELKLNENNWFHRAEFNDRALSLTHICSQTLPSG